jgi:hypothetical protein
MGADKIVDVGFQEFNRLQQSATRSRHLLETKRAENRQLCAVVGIRLGHRGSGVQIAPPQPNVSIAYIGPPGALASGVHTNVHMSLSHTDSPPRGPVNHAPDPWRKKVNFVHL